MTNNIRRIFILIFIACLGSMLSGCALLALPGQLIGGIFSLLGQVLGVVQSLPMPPPWVFI